MSGPNKFGGLQPYVYTGLNALLSKKVVTDGRTRMDTLPQTSLYDVLIPNLAYGWKMGDVLIEICQRQNQPAWRRAERTRPGRIVETKYF